MKKETGDWMPGGSDMEQRIAERDGNEPVHSRPANISGCAGSTGRRVGRTESSGFEDDSGVPDLLVQQRHIGDTADTTTLLMRRWEKSWMRNELAG